MDLIWFFIIINAAPFILLIAYCAGQERRKRQKELEDRVKKLEEQVKEILT